MGRGRNGKGGREKEREGKGRKEKGINEGMDGRDGEGKWPPESGRGEEEKG